jgi:hypothetical protein
MSDVIYHYCSLDAFKGIVESRCLWASSFRYMNDASEAVATQKALGENHDVVLRRFRDSPCHDAITQVLDHVSNIEKIEFFLVSFCRQPDKLSQWRYYADQGRGVAIGFSKRALAQYLVKDVLYGELESHIVNTCAALVKEFTVDDVAFRKQCTRSFIELVALTKSEAFVEEDECRLIRYYDRHNTKNHVKFRRSGNFLVPYVEIDLKAVWDYCITEVWLGPLIAQESVFRSIRFFMQSHEVKGATISESCAPFRQL